MPVAYVGLWYFCGRFGWKYSTWVIFLRQRIFHHIIKFYCNYFTTDSLIFWIRVCAWRVCPKSFLSLCWMRLICIDSWTLWNLKKLNPWFVQFLPKLEEFGNYKKIDAFFHGIEISQSLHINSKKEKRQFFSLRVQCAAITQGKFIKIHKLVQ